MARRRASFLFVFLVVGLLFSLLPTSVTYAQESDPPPPVSAAEADIDIEPRACINVFKVAHIAASIASIVPMPVPGFKFAADLAEFGANLALKGCPAVLTPPPKIVEEQPSKCRLEMTIPVAASWNELYDLDQDVFNELLEDQGIPRWVIPQLLDLLNTKYGRFENETYGSYSNLYGLVLPFELSEWAPGIWGDVGAPDIYHYNSDVFITLRHNGERIDDETVVFRPGTHSLEWQADTLISSFDYIPIFLLGTLFDSLSTQKATKEAGVETTKKASKQAAKEAAEEGTSKASKSFSKELSKRLLKKGGVVTLKIGSKLRHPYFVDADIGATNSAHQLLIIKDALPPEILGVDNTLFVEALSPGGALSGQTVPGLLQTIQVTDNCDEDPRLSYSTPHFWPLVLDANSNPIESAKIRWIAADNGAKDENGGVNESEVVQPVIVQDTLKPILVAPPPVIMEGTGNMEIPLGRPQVFDVADLRPQIEYSAPGTSQGTTWPVFSPGIHQVTWTATDASKNVSDPATQLVNIKEPGTNIPPVAIPQTRAPDIQVTTDEPFTITVRGQDGNNPPDPLFFSVVEQPKNGRFIAPLFPYFIDDYRMTARYSPQIAAEKGEDFAWELAADPSKMREYVKSLCAEDIERRDLPKDFISFLGGNEKYMTVDDDGYTYIYDTFYQKCHHGGGENSPHGPPRLSVWDPGGKYYGQLDLSDSGYPLRDISFDLPRGNIITTQSDGSTTGTSQVAVYQIQRENQAEPIVRRESYTLRNDVNSMVLGPDNRNRTPEFKNAGAAVWDNDSGILYVIGEQNLTGLAAFRTAPCDSRPEAGPIACLDFVDVHVYSLAINQSTKYPGYEGLGVDAMRIERLYDLALDDEGNVYVLGIERVQLDNGSYQDATRVYKFGAASVDEAGNVTLGDFIGWAGKCTFGENCNHIDQHSIGFTCTNETCKLDGSGKGTLPGQFDIPASIEIAPRNVIYVGDTNRVQRFTADGLFAGEARSTASCAGCGGFLLGEFGSPGRLAVNSNNFYILDIIKEIVHVFEASVIHNIDESSARVEYRSDTSYVGDDSFSFRVSDGFRDGQGNILYSDPATVALQVNRNFRPPQAVPQTVMTAEDTPVDIVLEGFDLDKDPLTFELTSQPALGRLSGSLPNLTFVPEQDVYGEDFFSFVVKDPHSTSNEATVALVIENANDTPVVILQDPKNEPAVHYPYTLEALIVDQDFEDTHSIEVDWGDGTVEKEGELKPDGTQTGPILTVNDTVTSTLTGFHTYSGAGPYTLKVCATDSAGVEGCSSRVVSLRGMIDKVLEKNGTNAVHGDEDLVRHALNVSLNLPPALADATSAASVLTGTVGSGLHIFGMNFGGPAAGVDCRIGGAGASFRCELDPMTEATQHAIILVLDASGSSDIEGLAPGEVARVDYLLSPLSDDPIHENNSYSGEVTKLHTADFYVDSFEEGRDSNPGDGTCATSEDKCTLRAAVEEANALAGHNSIALSYGVYQLNLEEAAGRLQIRAESEDKAASGDLDITDDLTILGLSPDRTVIHANEADRVFEVHSAKLTLRDVMLTGGVKTDSDSGGGLAAHNSEVLLERVSITGNEAGSGGGIYVVGGSLTIKQSSLTNNVAKHTSNLGGGALANVRGSLHIENTTISGNRAVSGGGISISTDTNSDAVTLLHVTLLENNATQEGGGVFGVPVTMQNSILARNSAPVGPNCTTSLISQGHNLLGDLSGCRVDGTTVGNIVGAKPDLTGLERNAAETYSYAPHTGSAVIDRGTCVIYMDQQGFERPKGNGCDIGAIEYDASTSSDLRLYLPTVERR